MVKTQIKITVHSINNVGGVGSQSGMIKSQIKRDHPLIWDSPS